MQDEFRVLLANIGRVFATIRQDWLVGGQLWCYIVITAKIERVMASAVRRPKSEYAFSLVELSIVLVVLGLLVGGVLAGQSLIRAAQLRSVSNDFSRYQAATNTFRDKYFALPGDMTNATAFWGMSTACSGASATGTCNGNGNGNVDDNPTEIYRFWQQLALAGLIEGSYTNAASSIAIAGTNVPKSRLGTAYYSLPYDGSGGGNWYRFGTPATNPNYLAEAGQHFISLGVAGIDLSGSSPQGTGGVLKVEESWNIDTKLDDGLPRSGKVMTYFWCPSGCGPAIDPGCSGTTYTLSDTTSLCAVGFQVY